MIPLVDLKRQYKNLKRDLDREVLKVLSEGNFVLGKQVSEFETAFAKFTGARYCVGVGSGWDALHLSMKALEIKKGDEVIAPANTFIATIFPIIELGAKPILVDIDPDTYQMDIEKLEKSITKKTKAIIPVHLYGMPCQIDKIIRIAIKHNLLVIEDAAQAHGSYFKGRHLGTFGNAGAFSFYPGKNLGASGEAGAVVTNSKTLYQRVKIIRDVGQSKKYHHSTFGYNSRPDTLHAAVLLVKLKKLKEWNEKRRRSARLYRRFLSDLPIILPPEMGNAKIFNYHVFPIRTQKRDALFEFLKKNDVYCGIHYPIPVHLQKAVKNLKYKRGDFPITEKYAKELMSLPIYPEIKKSEIKKISDLIHKFFKNEKK